MNRILVGTHIKRKYSGVLLHELILYFDKDILTKYLVKGKKQDAKWFV